MFNQPPNPTQPKGSTNTVNSTLTIPEKFEALDLSLNTELMERSREIRTAMIALVARVHHFQIGVPGTAKSLLVRKIANRISDLDYQDENEVTQAGYFPWLLTKYTTPEEVLGPPSFPLLKEGKYVRVTDYKLPVARIAFLDEIFKANSSILNALLTIMNERLFFNAGTHAEVPLSTVFAASNEEPAGDELNALWDRLHFRHEVKPVQDGGNFVRMLQARGWDNEKLISWDDIEAAQQAADEIVLPSDIYEAFKTLRDNLAKEGVEPTERRFVESLRIVRAEAYLNGRNTAEIDDMRSLRHVMWSQMKDQRTVERVVLELANPIDKEANELRERIEILDSELNRIINDGDNPKTVAKQAVEIHTKLHKAKQRMKDLEVRCKDTGRSSEELTETKKLFVSVAKKLMSQGFGVDGDPRVG